jgi:hypothetical protein
MDQVPREYLSQPTWSKLFTGNAFAKAQQTWIGDAANRQSNSSLTPPR